jgi:hypothetical protein
VTRRLIAALLLGLCLGPPSGAHGQGSLVHGADSVFATPDVTIVWGVLRASASAEGEVVIRIAAAPRFQAVSVEAVDPFSGARRAVAGVRSLAGPIDLRRPRPDFADFPRLEVRLYEVADAGAASLTVYYLGVPDTTPEFATEAALLRYVEDAVARVRTRPPSAPR